MSRRTRAAHVGADLALGILWKVLDRVVPATKPHVDPFPTHRQSPELGTTADHLPTPYTAHLGAFPCPGTPIAHEGLGDARCPSCGAQR